MIKAIVLDLDGTLLNSRKEITPDTNQALLRAQKAGIRLALASARSLNGLARFGRQLELERDHGMLICYNGGLISDAQTGQTLYSKAMPKELAAEICRFLKQYDVIPMIDSGKYLYLHDAFGGKIHYNGSELDIIRYEAGSNEFLICETEDLAEWIDFDVPKILVAAEPELLDEIEEELAAPFRDRAKAGRTAPYYFEYNAKDADKAAAMLQAFEAAGISPDEMMAFGDAQNDESMIRAVGYGIAMGNAVDSLKQAAFGVTDDCDHDGIAKAIYRYIPELKDNVL